MLGLIQRVREASVEVDGRVVGRGQGGRQPGGPFRCAPPEKGRALYEAVIRLARERGVVVETGEFGASTRVRLNNDGPVTIPLSIR